MKKILSILGVVSVLTTSAVANPMYSFANNKLNLPDYKNKEQKITSEEFLLNEEFKTGTASIHYFSKPDGFYKALKENLNALITDANERGVKNVKNFDISFLDKTDKKVLDLDSITTNKLACNLTDFFNKFLNIEDSSFDSLENGSIVTSGPTYVTSFGVMDGILGISFDVLTKDDSVVLIESESITLDHNALSELSGDFKLELKYEI